MYVCLCKGVTDTQVRQAVEEGHDTMRKLNKTLGVGSQCGRCACFAKELIRETKGNSLVSEEYMAAAARLARPAA